MSPQEDDIIQSHYEEEKVEDNGYNLSTDAHKGKISFSHT
jgi:hypothetical protein